MKRKNIYIILLLSMFALTSCKVGKSYVRPEMALPDSLAQQQEQLYMQKAQNTAGAIQGVTGAPSSIASVF